MTTAQRVLESVPTPILLLDTNLVVREVNPAFGEVFSTAREETVGGRLREAAGGAFADGDLLSAVQDLVDRETSFHDVDIDHVCDQRGTRHLQVDGQHLVGSPQDPDRLLLTVRDVTNHRALERKLRARTAAVERSNRDLEEFARVASHDLQEPLRMVSNYLQLLERRYTEHLPDTAKEFIGYAVDGAERMKGLVNGLLQYSRVGRKEEAFARVSLDPLVDDVLQDLERQIDAEEATVTRDALPTVYGNADQLRRVFQNLIENALTYSGDAAPRIEIAGEEMGDGGAHVMVHDDGIGIPPEGQEKIFKLFKQIDPHGAGHAGSGMGLAICNRIAERHGGEMWVESEPGEGSTFHATFQLPPDRS